jgi:hypothetical protein
MRGDKRDTVRNKRETVKTKVTNFCRTISAKCLDRSLILNSSYKKRPENFSSLPPLMQKHERLSPVHATYKLKQQSPLDVPMSEDLGCYGLSQPVVHIWILGYLSGIQET